MAGDIYALLVGINEYSPDIGRLSGCINDVDHFHAYLRDSTAGSNLHVEVLENGDATRLNIIEQFRGHLARAKAGDVAVFQFCGHGARWKSATAFHHLSPDGKDEGLVCADSRGPTGGFDLADKELAVLLAELSGRGPEIAVVLDCCHSGSATRTADDFSQARARQTHEVLEERPLDSYLNGHYARMIKRGEFLELPASRHILLSACERKQKAWETRDRRGVFTTTLLEVLGAGGPQISYADLFVRCRAAVRRRVDNQEPQFETHGGFDAYGGFLGRESAGRPPRVSVVFLDGSWQIDRGALHGLPSEPEKRVELALFPETGDSGSVGSATTTKVGAQKSELELRGFDADPSRRYQAEITSLPVPPLVVSLDGDPAATARIQERAAEVSIGVALVRDAGEETLYSLSAEDGSYLLRRRATGQLVQGARPCDEAAASLVLRTLGQVAQWHRALGLHNAATTMDSELVPFWFSETLDDGRMHRHAGDEVTIDIDEVDGKWRVVRGSLGVQNLTSRPLHLAVLYFSESYGVQPIINESLEASDSELTIPLPGTLELREQEGDETTDVFKLIVTTEKVDDFVLGQQPLPVGEILSPQSERGFYTVQDVEARPKLSRNEWFTKDLRIKLVRQLDRVTPKDASLAGGRITIKGHPSLQAGVALGGVDSLTRGVGSGSDVHRALERQGMELVQFSSKRGGNESVLELTDIRNSETLAEEPLEIELDLDLEEDEYILPLVFDGEDVLVAGDPSRDDAGRTHVRIDHVPDVPDHRRSLGKALKLYFFKAWLKRAHVNQLCWVEYDASGAATRHSDGVAEKVREAGKVLLLIHGIIGDTQGMTDALPGVRGQEGNSLHERFDLILTYDYENLSTPIDETARGLKDQLAAAGLGPSDDRQLTILAHSMGGLVSRWFVEREGGDEVVDHLVMCGTPNAGSPFGQVDSVRTVTKTLTGLAIKVLPPLAPFGAAVLYAIERSRRITPCLEQMNSASPFYEQLNASEDPGVRYTVLAGDTREFLETSSGFSAKLLAKAGRGAALELVYGGEAHDIAVSVASIHGVPTAREPQPVKEGVVCHHLNYFTDEAGIRALASIDWD